MRSLFVIITLNLFIFFKTLMTTTPTARKDVWYKNYMIIVFVIGLPVFVVIACIFFIIYAVNHRDSTVRDDWYMDGKALYQDASKDQRAYDYGVGGVMRFDGNKVAFELNYPETTLKTQAIDFYPKNLSVVISHATDHTKDRDFVLTHTGDNRYQGEVVLDGSSAKYYLQVSYDDNKEQAWRLIHAHRLPAQNVPFFPLKAFAKNE